MPNTKKSASLGPRPDRPAERPLHPNDELQARPGATRTDGKKRRVVHADQLGEAANPVLGNASAEVENDEAGDLGLGGASLAVGPVVDEVDGALAAGTGHDANAMSEGDGYISNHSIEELVELYVPRQNKYWKEVRPLVIAAVMKTNPTNWQRTAETMLILFQYMVWAWKVGARDLDLDDLLSGKAVHRYMAAQTHMSRASWARKDSQLARVVEAHTGVHPGNAPWVDNTSDPYTREELAECFSVAKSYSTERMRSGSLLIIALGAGAGLNLGEVARLRNSDIDGHMVTVSGKYARRVPVIPAYRQYLQPGGRSSDYVVLPQLPRGASPVKALMNFLHSLPGHSVIPRRLKATWVSDLFSRGVKPEEFAELTGQKTMRPFERYFDYLPDTDGTEETINRLYEGSVA